jgi:hypothetical protein
MAPGRLSRLLHSERWRPYILGSVASLPIMVVVLLAWKYHPDWAAWWTVFCFVFAGLDVFHKTPTRKMISFALFLGTLASYLIVFVR